MGNEGLGAWIRRRRVKSRDTVAVRSAYRDLGYPELAERINRLAHGLRERGVRQGDRIAYLGNNHPAFLESLFATGLLGAVFVPLNTRLAAREIAYALGDSGARVLICSSQLEELAAHGSQASQIGLRIVVSPHPDGDAGSADGGYPVERYEKVLAASSSEDIDVTVGLDDPALILYTSGTTGRPKGAVLSHGNMTWNAVNVLVDYDVTSADVALMIAPLFHVASLGMGALPTLLKGGTLVLHETFEPRAVLAAIQEHGVTSLSGVPTTFQLLAEHPDWDATDISSLNKLTCGGSAVPTRVLDAYEARGLSFSCGYGMTETAPGATSLPPERTREKAGSSGLPHFFTEMRIADLEGVGLPAGEVGEIQIRGPNVIGGYWNRPQDSAAAFAEGGWFRSGDLGSVDAEGFLHVTGRLKEMLVSGGENVYPAEIEQLIMELPQIESAAVIGVPDETWGEVPKAVVVVKEGQECTLDQIRSHLDGRLARYKIPKHLERVPEMPRTASGKIRKAELRDARSDRDP